MAFHAQASPINGLANRCFALAIIGQSHLLLPLLLPSFGESHASALPQSPQCRTRRPLRRATDRGRDQCQHTSDMAVMIRSQPFSVQQQMPRVGRPRDFTGCHDFGAVELAPGGNPAAFRDPWPELLAAAKLRSLCVKPNMCVRWRAFVAVPVAFAVAVARRTAPQSVAPHPLNRSAGSAACAAPRCQEQRSDTG
jgi:hypothetical protein